MNADHTGDQNNADDSYRNRHDNENWRRFIIKHNVNILIWNASALSKAGLTDGMADVRTFTAKTSSIP